MFKLRVVEPFRNCLLCITWASAGFGKGINSKVWSTMGVQSLLLEGWLKRENRKHEAASGGVVGASACSRVPLVQNLR